MTDELQSQVGASFGKHFGDTSIAKRIADLERQIEKVSRHVDSASLREATGDLICSVLQLANEQECSADTLVADALGRIEERGEIYAKLGRRLNVGILSGAFDPVHSRHIELTRRVLSSSAVDEVWWMPSYGHLAGKQMASADHRLAMCRAASADFAGAVRVSDFEIQTRFLGETYHLAKKLAADKAIRSRCNLHMIVSQENVESMHSSSNFEALRRFIPFIVVPFGDSLSAGNAWYRQKPHRLLEEDPIEAKASSTDIRRRIASGDPQLRDLVPEPVLDYIATNELYGDATHAGPSKNVKRIAVMIGSFDPPTLAQVKLVELLLSRGFEKVRILPAARIRDGVVVEHAESVHRAALVDLAFGGRPRVEISFSGLEDERAVSPTVLFRNHDVERGELFFVVTEEAVAGRDSHGDLRNAWQDGERLWAEASFVLVGQSPQVESRDLPPKCEFATISDLETSNLQQPADLRRQIADGTDISAHVPSSVDQYVKRHRLFRPIRLRQAWPTSWKSPRIRLVFDERNEKAVRLAQRYARWEAPNAELILVLGGDGTMLHAIRRYWRLRLPFVGINTGHLGFLLNQDPFDSLDDLDVTTYRMPMLQVTVENPAHELRHDLAFSDAWIERKSGQAAWLRLDVNGETRVPKLVGDGLLVATPSGSSSYARAMGGSPVPLDSQSLTIAGSNVFRPRFWNTLIMPADASIRIATLDHTGKRPVQAFIDGVPMGLATSMSICRSNTAAVELGFARDSDLSSKLLTSLLPDVEDE